MKSEGVPVIILTQRPIQKHQVVCINHLSLARVRQGSAVEWTDLDLKRKREDHLLLAVQTCYFDSVRARLGKGIRLIGPDAQLTVAKIPLEMQRRVRLGVAGLDRKLPLARFAGLRGYRHIVLVTGLNDGSR